MATREPDFFYITDTRFKALYITKTNVRLSKVLWHELRSAFVKRKCMSEMTRVCYRRVGGDVHVFLDETQRRHRVPRSKSA